MYHAAAQSQAALTDHIQQHFLRHGVYVVPPGGQPGLHAVVRAKASAIAACGPEATWRLGDGVLAAIPELAQAIEAPQVRQALSSILGENYMLHGHRHLHASSEADQMWHKDSYWGFRLVRRHRPRWCMLLYYPQDTVLSMGPTCVLAGSQYWTVDTEGQGSHEDIQRPDNGEMSMFASGATRAEKEQKLREAKQNYLSPTFSHLVEEVTLTVPAGSCVLMHYDLFHRASSRQSATAPVRFMVKFQFLRTQEPVRHSLPHAMPMLPVSPEVDPILQDVRHWLLGLEMPLLNPGARADVNREQDAQVLESPQAGEVLRVAAAYRLAETAAGWPHLLRALQSEHEGVARAAAYGLSAAGPRAALVLSLQLFDRSPRVRRLAAFAVGESGQPDALLLTALSQALSHEDSQDVVAELLLALALLAAKARALGQVAVSTSCASIALSWLKPVTGGNCIKGEAACLVMLMAGGSTAAVGAEVLQAMRRIASTAGCDRYMANFAVEFLSRSLQAVRPLHALRPHQVAQVPRPICYPAKPWQFPTSVAALTTLLPPSRILARSEAKTNIENRQGQGGLGGTSTPCRPGESTVGSSISTATPGSDGVSVPGDFTPDCPRYRPLYAV